MTSDFTAASGPSASEFRNRLRRRAKSRKDDRQLYSNSRGPHLRDSYVAYVDALGTKASMQDLSTTRLRELIRDRDRFLTRLFDPEFNNWGRMVSFTDNIVFGTPAFDRERGELLQLATALCAYQQANTAAGRFIRGGLVRGPLYIDSSFATGHGLVRAVDLEESRAIHPRILLSRNVLEPIAAEAQELTAARDSPHNHVFLLDQDGETFLNYLAPAPRRDPDSTAWISRASLADHRQAVEKALRTEPEPSRARDKFVWAAHLHNWLCDELEYDDLSIADGLSRWERTHGRAFEWMFGRPSIVKGKQSTASP